MATESGWVANTVPAIYTGAKMKAYREWLPQPGFEANLALAGSYVPDRVAAALPGGLTPHLPPARD